MTGTVLPSSETLYSISRSEERQSHLLKLLQSFSNAYLVSSRHECRKPSLYWGRRSGSESNNHYAASLTRFVCSDNSWAYIILWMLICVSVLFMLYFFFFAGSPPMDSPSDPYSPANTDSIIEVVSPPELPISDSVSLADTSSHYDDKGWDKYLHRAVNAQTWSLFFANLYSITTLVDPLCFFIIKPKQVYHYISFYFLLLMFLSTFLQPFCVLQDKRCVTVNKTSATFFILYRTVVDLLLIVNILLQVCFILLLFCNKRICWLWCFFFHFFCCSSVWPTSIGLLVLVQEKMHSITSEESF